MKIKNQYLCCKTIRDKSPMSSSIFALFASLKALCASCLADPGSSYFIQQRSMKLMQYFRGVLHLKLFKTSAWEQAQGLCKFVLRAHCCLPCSQLAVMCSWGIITSHPLLAKSPSALKPPTTLSSLSSIGGLYSQELRLSCVWA